MLICLDRVTGVRACVTFLTQRRRDAEAQPDALSAIVITCNNPITLIQHTICR